MPSVFCAAILFLLVCCSMKKMHGCNLLPAWLNAPMGAIADAAPAQMLILVN